MSHWTEEENKLIRHFEFKNFNEALDFVNKVGVLAENMQHHPDILLHGYKNVSITLTTHDAGGVTDKDHKLAELIEKLLNR